MSRRGSTVLMLGGLIVAGSASAQSQTSDREPVRREDVKTWVMTIHGKDYEARPATPGYDGGTGLFHLPTAYTLPKGGVAVSLFRDNLDRDPKDEDISVHGVTLGVGVTSRFELSASFGLQNRINADLLGQPGYVNDYPFVATPWQTGRGDLRIGAKYKLLDDYGSDPVGLALRGYVKLPSADENKGLGTGKRSMGVDLVMSKSLGRAADIHAALGYQWNGDPETPRAVDIGDAMKWGVGINLPTCTRVQVQAEITGTKYRNASFEQTNPIDLVVGPVVWLSKGVFIRPAISKNLKYDDYGRGSGARSSMGMQVSVGYHPGSACCAIAVPQPPPPPPPPTPAPAPPVNRDPTVVCEAAKPSVSTGEIVALRAVASDPDNDALTYAWSTDMGRVSGTDASATLDTTTIAGPANIDATVKVSDGRGGTASASCHVRIQAPARAPETVSCASTGFPPNRDRLNNVDKACLDDVALRLRQDPRSRVLIIGHADQAERRPDLLSRQRAEATKAYLVTDRGIEHSRVTTRGAGAAETGAGGANRRVEVIFVPEGATPPAEK